MLAHANLTEVNYSHDTYVQWQHRLALLVTGNHWDAKALSSDRVCF